MSAPFLTIERQFAEAVAGQCMPLPEPSLQFIAYLFAATRQGHLRVKIEQESISPSPEALFPEGGIDPHTLLEGAASLPPSLCGDGTSLTPIVKKEMFYYLQRFFWAEKSVEKHWNRLIESGLSLPIDREKLQRNLEQLPKDSLNEKQLEAINQACTFSPFILTGGPGSGKTFLAGKMLHLLRESCSASYFTDQVVLAAPTGKAALALQNSLSKSLGLSKGLQAQTLHALLGLTPGSKKSTLPPPFLPYSVFVIDEASMIDIELMDALLSRIRSGSLLLLIGDPWQLPPVEGPPIFPQLVSRHPHKTELTECKRVESLPLVEAARKLAQGVPLEKALDVKLLDKESEFQKLIETWVSRFTLENKDIRQAREAFKRFKILTPLRHTKWGSEALNQKIVKALLKKGQELIPLAMNYNDYDLGFFNGDSAILDKKEPSFPLRLTLEDKVIFEGGGELPAPLLSSYELGYVSTIHKSQGSEYEDVVLLLPPDAVLSEALLYTAVTRARKNIVIYRFNFL